MSDRSMLLAFVALLPQYLRNSHRGWQGLLPLLAEHGLSRPAFFLLTALTQETDPEQRLDVATMQARLFNPYATIFPFVAHLPELVATGELREQAGAYVVTPQGRAFALRVEAAARDYVAARPTLAAADLAWLVAMLAPVVDALCQAPEPAQKWHQSRVHRLPPLPANALASARLDGLVFALWQARDDAHIAAWQAAGFTGPRIDLLSHLWRGTATDLAMLVAAVQTTQRTADVAASVAWMDQAGYLAGTTDPLLLTPVGREIREAVEAETDRVYFAPWPDWSQADCERLVGLFQQLCTALSQ